VQKENSQQGKEGTDDFGSDLDTDGFKVSGLEGLERDKRGELVILLPDDERTIARQRGFHLPRADEAPGAKPAAEKGSQFSGVLVEEPQEPAPPEAAPAPAPPKPRPPGAPAQAKAGPAPAPVDYGPTQVLIPDSLQKKAGPNMGDFDLEFRASAATAGRRKHQEPEAPQPEKAEGKVKKAPAWVEPQESKPIAPPAAPPQKEAPKKEIAWQEPELPDDYSAPVVIKRRREEKPREEPAPDMIQARSYLDDERVIEEPPARTSARATKKKMKLPRKVRKGKQTSPLLVLMLILVLLVLAGVLAVQYVPEAREYYEKIIADISGAGEAPPAKPAGPRLEDERVVVTVGAERVYLGKGAKKDSVEAYVKSLREALREGGAAASGKAGQ
jgi:hypothetical protein